MAELKALAARAQLAAIAFARWRLAVNSMRTTRGAMELVSRLWIGCWVCVLGLAGAVGFGAGGWYFLHRGQAEGIALLLWPLFLFWQVFPLAASAFSQHVDSANLARFPLRYPTYVGVRVAFGSLDIATLAGCLCMMGLSVGLGVAAPALLAWTAAMAALFVIFNILLAQMICAWLERWLAQRRTREILALLFFAAIFAANFISPLARRWRQPEAGTELGRWAALLPLERWLPPGLPAHALACAANGRWGVGAAAGLLLAGWAAGILALLHLRLRAEYRGESWSEAAAARPARREMAAAPAPGRGHMPRRMAPAGRSGPVTAIAQKELRYLLRSPMMFFSLVMPVLLLVFFRLSAMRPAAAPRPGPFHVNAPGLGFPLGVAYALLVLSNLIFNAFGTDGAGIQFYFAAPVRFRQILLGKNLAHGTILAIEVVVIYVAAAFIDAPPAAWVLAATLLGLAFAALANFGCGNLLSIYLPKKIDLGRLGRQGGRGASGLAALAVQGVLAGCIACATLGGAVLGLPWLALALLAGLALCAAGGYGAALHAADAWAQARREVLIAELSKS